MKVMITGVPYDQFQAFMLAYAEVQSNIRKLNQEYQAFCTPVLMNAHESKEYHNHQEKLSVAQYQTYRFGNLILEHVYIASYKATHNSRFQIVDEHVVPIHVDLEIEYGN